MIHILAILTVVIASSVWGHDGFLSNGSFEEVDSRGKPVGWSFPADGKLAADAVTGRRSAAWNGALSQWGLTLPAGQYQIRFHVKKDNMNWLGVRLFCRDSQKREIRQPSLTRYFGQGKAFPEWEAIEFVADIPEHAGACGIIFSSHGGLMVIDDVSIDKVRPSVTDGELVFSDQFQREALGDDWKVESGSWKIQDGVLTVTGVGTENRIKFARPLGRNLRVEYTCWSTSPQDLSGMLGADETRSGLNGYVFGFAANYNSYNYIATTRPFHIIARTIQEGFNTGAIPGEKHRIVLEKREGKLRLFRDGRLELLAEDMFEEENQGRSFGLFTYHAGSFSDIKVYRLPEAKTVALKPEYPVEKILLHDFSGKADASLSNSQIIAYPTWDYARTPGKQQIVRDDPCLKTADASFDLPATRSGIVEFDLLVPGSRQVRAELVDGQKRCVAALIVDDQGLFKAEGQDGIVPLNCQIEYRRRLLYDTLKVEREKWYTLRIKYDFRNRRIDNFGLLDLYTENHPGTENVLQGQYVSLGGKLPFKAGVGEPKSLRIISDGGMVLVDNVLRYGPVGFKRVRGKNILLSSRELLGLSTCLRRDPMRLKTQSMRHLDPTYQYVTPTLEEYRNGGGKPSFQQWAHRYNEQLMQVAFLRERMELLERREFYAGRPVGAIADFREAFQGLETLQDLALRRFANAFWHQEDESLLRNDASRVLDKLVAAVSELQRQLDARDHAGRMIPAVPIYHHWNLTYDGERKLWLNQGRPEAFISSVSQFRKHLSPQAMEFVLDKMRALGIQPASVTVGGVTNGSPKQGELFNYSYFDEGLKRSIDLVKSHRLNPYGLAWMQHGTGQMRMPVPLWWLEQNQRDRDIFFATPEGITGETRTPIYRGWPHYPFLALNFWNDKVQKYIRDRYFLYGKKMSAHRDLFGNVQFYLGGESSITLPGGLYPGYAASSVAEFRRQLRRQHGTVAALNRAWKTSYSSFQDITPPPPGAAPSPLKYAFGTFVHREYFDRYIRLAKESLERGFGRKLSIGHDFQDTFSEFDMPAFFDNVSIALFHSYQIWDRKIYPKYLRSLAEATGTPWGAIEWGYTQGCKTMFDLEEIRLQALREISHQLMLGCASPNFFAESLCGGMSDWQYGFPMTDHRLGFMPFSYHASFWRIAKDRGMRFGEKALTAKTVRPDIAVLEVDSARRNALPDRSVYAMCKDFSDTMERQSRHYGFLFETLVVDGRQKLDGIPMVFVPNGIVMRPELDRKLERYVHQGGVIIAFAPPGVFDQYGLPKSEGLLRKAFPQTEWTHERFGMWTAHGRTLADGCYQASWGQGKVYVFPTPMQWEQHWPAFKKLMASHIDPTITCDRPRFQTSLREDETGRYLYVLNHGMTDTEVATLSLRGAWNVRDISLPHPMNLKTEEANGRTTLKIRLAPAELALLSLTKR